MIRDEETLPPEKMHPHYYGTLVRKYLFFAAFIIMIGALVDSELRSFYIFVGLFGVVGVTVLAGLTSPQKRAIMSIDVLVSATMFLIFEYFAIDAYARYEDFSNTIFFFRQLIAVVFLITLYYSTKTIRYHQAAESKQD